MLGALIVFGFSFAPFIQYEGELRELSREAGVSLVFDAWSLETFMVPLTTFVVLAAVLTVGSVALRFALARDPEVLRFRLRQLEVGMAVFAALVLLGMVASSKYPMVGTRRLADAGLGFGGDVPLATGWGSIVMLLGSFVLLAGTLLNHFDVGPAIPVAGSTGGHPAGGWPGHPQPAVPYQPGSWQPAPSQQVPHQPAPSQQAPHQPAPGQPGPPGATGRPGA